MRDNEGGTIDWIIVNIWYVKMYENICCIISMNKLYTYLTRLGNIYFWNN